MDEGKAKGGRSGSAGCCTASLAARRCLRAGFPLAGETAALLSDYLNLLMRWNRRMNLVGAARWEDALDNLVMDSFWLARFLEQEVFGADSARPAAGAEDGGFPETWDLGAGAGLPGIALRMVWRRGRYWMVESRGKRALFLATVLARLHLPHTRVFRGRAEIFMAGRTADLILGRAFMPWREMLEMVRPCLNPGGMVILLTREAVRPEKGWVCAASFSYQAGGVTRLFSALAGA
jgi:16S rRNA (guanine527-N7)-methyltransferase